MRLGVVIYRKTGLLLHFSSRNFSVRAVCDSFSLSLIFKVTHPLLFKVSLSLVV